MLSVQNLVKRYGSLTAVDDVSFDIQKGSCFGLLGPNGAGKTTTISMIVGVAKPDRGKILLEGSEIKADDPRVKKRIGFIPQDLAVYEELSAIDNLRFFGQIYGLAGDKLKSRCDEVLHLISLADRAKEPVTKFSGGMKRRLNIGIALLHDPDILILDEPTVGVDPQSRNAIFDNLMELQRQGKTLIYTSHYMEEVERLCDTIAIMDHGKVVAQGPKSSLRDLLPSTQRLTLSLAGPSDGVSESLLQLDGVTAVEDIDSSLIIDIDSLANAGSILTLLESKGHAVTAMSSNTLSLEEVFLHLTGRSLRD